jgi:hypothetical protein
MPRDECLDQLVAMRDVTQAVLDEYKENLVISDETIKRFRLLVLELLWDWERAEDNTKKYE